MRVENGDFGRGERRGSSHPPLDAAVDVRQTATAHARAQDESARREKEVPQRRSVIAERATQRRGRTQGTREVHRRVAARARQRADRDVPQLRRAPLLELDLHAPESRPGGATRTPRHRIPPLKGALGVRILIKPCSPPTPQPSSTSLRSTHAPSRAVPRCRSPRWWWRPGCWSSPAARCTRSADALQRARSTPTRAGSLAAVGFEMISFSGYIALLWMVGERATPRMDLRASAQVTLAGAAVTRLLPTGWRRRRRPHAVGAAPHRPRSRSSATRTLLTFLVLLYAVFLLSIAGRRRAAGRRPRRRGRPRRCSPPSPASAPPRHGAWRSPACG